MAVATTNSTQKRDWSWRSQVFRGTLYQIIAVILIGGVAWFLASQHCREHAYPRHSGRFRLPETPAGFDIGESLFHFDSNDPYWKAFLIKQHAVVAIVGIVPTTILAR